MMTHDRLYKIIGVRRLLQFKDPLVMAGSDFVFPKESEIYYFNLKDTVEPISKDVSFLRNNKNIIVFTKTKYKNPIGKFTNKEHEAKKIVTKMKKKESRFKFIMPGSGSATIGSSVIPMYNYNLINVLHRYSSHPMNVYYKWYNGFNTLVSDLINGTNTNLRHKYVILDLPATIPNFTVMEKHVDKINTQTFKFFPTVKHMMLLDFWRLLTPKLFKDSLLSKLNPEQMKMVNFVLTINGKVSLLNLHVLVSAIKQYDAKDSINKLDATIFRKLFLLYVFKVSRSPSSSIGEIVGTSIPNNMGMSGISKVEKNITIGIKESDDEDEDIDESDIDDDLDDNASKSEEEAIINSMIDEDITLVEVKETVEDIPINIEDSNSGNKKRIKKLLDEGLVSSKVAKDILAILDEQKDKKSPYGEGTLGDMFTITKSDKELPKEILTPPSPSNPNAESNTNIIEAIDKSYIKKLYKKHVLKSVYGIQNNGMIIDNYTIEKETSILGSVETHKFDIIPLKGKPSTVSIKLPVINDEGVFTISGNNYVMRKQKTDIPIRKTRPTRVALTSYYSKVFIDKVYAKKDDIGYWFANKLKKAAAKNQAIKDVVSMSYKLPDVTVPRLYSTISRYTLRFIVDDEHYNFSYNDRAELLNKKDKLKDIERNGKYLLVAKKQNGYVLMDNNGELFNLVKNVITPHQDIFDTVGVGHDYPVEYVVVKLFTKKIPIALLLVYYNGLNKLLKLTKVKHEIVDRNKRVSISDNQYVVTFEDKKIIFDSNDYENSLIFGGLASMNKNLKYTTMDMLNSRDGFSSLIDIMGIGITYFTEIKLMESMYIDPTTLEVLKEMKEPETFEGLLFRAVELLKDDNYNSQNDASGILIKGMERIPGMIYKTLVKETRTFENKNMFGKAKMVVNPYEVWQKINDDSTSELVNDLNPIVNLKQSEEVTLLGSGGRSKDAIGKETRIFSPSEVGVISEATKDSGDVGVTFSLSSNPRITNLLGMVQPSGENDKLNASNILSTSAMLAPMSFEDDPKRLGFTSIQNSHTISFKGMKSSGVRTGYEGVIPYRVKEKFCYNAEQDGIVSNISKSNILITYKDGTKKDVKLGEWVGKEESGIAYTHNVVTNLKKGDSVKNGWNISYDNGFFEPDIFDKNKVIYRQGTVIKTVLTESPDTYEDSHAITEKMSKELQTSVVKVKSLIVKFDDNIINMVSVGDKIKSSDSLFTIISGGENMLSSSLSKSSLETLESIKSKTPKAGLSGVINKITLFYNPDKTEGNTFSASIKNYINESDERLKKEYNDKNITGEVNNTYSIKGKPLNHGEIEIKIYIETTIPMGLGDKGIFANQLKTTVGDVLTQEIKTEEGEDIEAKFSTISINDRIVTSPFKIGTTNTILRIATEEIAKEYFGE